ncbi:MAG: hypothetical protein K9G70_01490 [Prolixibacteraceae bacterium]|nr:hypothetical protein [Prolixibacteraceae bacterium]
MKKFVFIVTVFSMFVICFPFLIKAKENNKKSVYKIAYLDGKEDAEGGNLAVIKHLEKKGYAVTVFIDSLTNPEQLIQENYNLLILPSTIGSWRAGKFKELSIPILAWESYAFDKELGMVADNPLHYGGVEFADSNKNLVNSINIIKPESELAAGLSGEIVVFNAKRWRKSVKNPESNFVYGIPNDNAIKIATIGASGAENDINKLYAIFAYDKGVEMAEKEFYAPEKRMGYYFHHAAPKYLTKKGWKIFDSSIEWLLK